MNKTTAETNREIACLLSNNLSRLLREFSRDFERRIWRALEARGYPDIRPSHSAVFANLGLGAVRVTELAEKIICEQGGKRTIVDGRPDWTTVTRTLELPSARIALI